MMMGKEGGRRIELDLIDFRRASRMRRTGHCSKVQPRVKAMTSLAFVLCILV